MKTSGWLVMAAAVGGLALQGCASNGGLHYAPGAAPTATTHAAPAITKIRNQNDFEAVARAVDVAMQPGGRYASVTANGRAEVKSHLQDMASLFGQYGTADNMNTVAMSRLDADQNAINAVLAAYDGNRLVCQEEMPVGSHLPKRVCRTLSEIHNDQNGAQRLLHGSIMRPSEYPAALEKGGRHGR